MGRSGTNTEGIVTVDGDLYLSGPAHPRPFLHADGTARAYEVDAPALVDVLLRTLLADHGRLRVRVAGRLRRDLLWDVLDDADVEISGPHGALA